MMPLEGATIADATAIALEGRKTPTKNPTKQKTPTTHKKPQTKPRRQHMFTQS